MNLTAKLHQLRVVIVTHEYATGPPHALATYLRGKTAHLAFIAHPFVFAKEKRSHLSIFDVSGVRVKEIIFPWHVPFQFVSVIKDAVLTLWWCIRLGYTDIFIGVDNINACMGILLQKVGLVKKTVFYTIDYIPHRFANPFINAVYHKLDAFAAKNADTLWNLSSIMELERSRKGLNDPEIRKKQIVVPVGTDAITNPVPFSKIKRYHLAHMGHLTKKQGVQSVIEAIPLIVTKLPHFHFDIIGGGPMESELLDMVQKLHLQKYVTFYGFIKNHDEVEALLAKCAAAIAPYVDSPDNFVRYTDPGKVKAYLAVGLPIIITKVPDVWKEIVKRRVGIAVSDNMHKIAEGIIKLLLDEKKLRSFRDRSLKLGREYSWNLIFAKSLRQTLH
ncbi:hypothetical protein A2973_00705 [Candidatus Gottesmanbacteria bacterium RIFCSPLOWO2_01_FULL_49_10]|uniref:Glycosyl transferase family 1 domain-containing protein n=1 Tax=Candidatus Gottesmanbacteria bacterium RIFCSPLOWO2_01_FULL_49_10 TaxID=1798396 RepID=A0A1F6AWP7_9BACT|nr:MAG: hypothetical protein UY10_C0002G0002 [Microgenomates group bacterium GW2011_GWA2_47_8]OGG29106.1 MAG: hypothetical protein A2973_00705 [Candidatus Gottesmanbacteria bacterium RIFCSPLOWO2_01_FULL_49_10]